MSGASAHHEQASARFDLSGGRLCLDFANTRRYKDPPREDIPTFADFMAWSEAAAALSPAQARELASEGSAHAEEAAAVMQRMQALRLAIYRTFSAVAADQEPPGEALVVLGRAAAEASVHQRLVFHDGRVHLEVPPESRALDRVLWAIARDAVDLLLSDFRSSVRECDLETCAWLFLDRSRNQSRRWCDMKVCGNRSKARRHQAKQKKGRAKGPSPASRS